jgi:hypothetical protein
VQPCRLPVAVADGEVNVLAREVHVVQRGAHAQIDVGMRLGETARG